MGERGRRVAERIGGSSVRANDDVMMLIGEMGESERRSTALLCCGILFRRCGGDRGAEVQESGGECLAATAVKVA